MLDVLATLRRATTPGPGSHADAGGIVLGWLTKLTVTLAIVGVVLFDAISVGSTKATLADQGRYAAREASETWQLSKSIQQTYVVAQQVAAEQNKHNAVSTTGFKIDPDGTVHLLVRREAPTLVLFRWSRTREWTQVRASVQGLSAR